MAMDRPDGIPQWALDAAEASIEDEMSWSEGGIPPSMIASVARAIFKAHQDAFDEAAKIAEGPTATPGHYRVIAGNIAQAIRQHSQKGEK